jgi:hypothetical protein
MLALLVNNKCLFLFGNFSPTKNATMCRVRLLSGNVAVCMLDMGITCNFTLHGC